jgi:hypothetical protein
MFQNVGSYVPLDVDALCVIELLDQPFIGFSCNMFEFTIEKLMTSCNVNGWSSFTLKLQLKMIVDYNAKSHL